MRNHTKIRNMKRENRRNRRGRTLTSLLLAVMLTLGCICTGTVQASASTGSSDTTTCSHKWKKQIGNVGHIRYTKPDGLFCGCGAGPFSKAALGKHRLRDHCYGNYYASPKDEGSTLEWIADTYYECSLCGERKIPAVKDPDTGYLGGLKNKLFGAGKELYKVTGLVPQRTVTCVCSSDSLFPSSLTVPDTVKFQVRLYSGEIQKKETFKVTGIGENAFINEEFASRLVIGKNVKSIGKNAFKNCRGLKTIEIRTAELTADSIGDGAFSGTSKKATATVPKSRLKEYKKLLKQKGFKGKVKAGSWKETKGSKESGEPKNPSVKARGGRTEYDTVYKWAEEARADGMDLDAAIESLDTTMVEARKKLDDRDEWFKCAIEDDMNAFFAYMDDDIIIEVSRQLGGRYTIGEFLDAYLKKDSGELLTAYIYYRVKLDMIAMEDIRREQNQ